jgi:DNA-binding LacI/PurR family transcriptional regulator
MKPKKLVPINRTVDMDAIAQKLGVSKTTVHYALSRKGRVSEAVRDQILNLAREMGYRPNLLARSLRTKRTQTIGVILSSLNSSFHAHLLEALDHAAQQNGYNIFLACSYRDADKERELFDMMLSKGVDGIIAAPTSNEEHQAVYTQMGGDGVPIVFVDRDVPKSHIDCVSVDNFVGGKLAAEHLLESGRKRLGFVTMAHRGHQSSTVKERLNGFNYALQTAGLPSAKVWGKNVISQSTGEAVGYEIVHEALTSEKTPFDAVFASNDNLAYGAMRAIREANRAIPGDIAVVGFDDQDASAFVEPPLTTIRQPVQSVGEAAVELLLKHLNADPATIRKESERIKIEPTLIKRGSS